MEINELDEKYILDYLIDENNFLESEIIRSKTELKGIEKEIESILNLKTISWDGIKLIKEASYTGVASLIADNRVDLPSAIFYFYTDNEFGLTMVDAIKCSELPDYKDNFELYELVCNKIKTIANKFSKGNLYYIKGFILNNEFIIGNDFSFNISIMTRIENLTKE